MRINQSNRYNMIKGVIAVLRGGITKVAVVPAIAAALARLEQIVETISIKELERSDDTTGKLDVRDNVEDMLVEALVPVASALTAYASVTKNVELFEKAKIKKAAMYRLRDNELVLKAKAILTLAQQYIDKLGDYAVTAQSLNDLQQYIADFEAAIANVDKGHSGRSGARIAVHDAFDAADDVLKNQLDKMMETVRKTDPQLYNEYISARVIHDLGGGHGKDKGQNPAPPDAPAPPAK